jgi:hypothetical protein
MRINIQILYFHKINNNNPNITNANHMTKLKESQASGLSCGISDK